MKKLIFALAFTVLPLSAQADSCVRLVKQAGSEILVNTCDACRTAKVERDRPGTATGVPSMREYLIPGKGHQPLSFRGPGRTRVVASLPCPGKTMSGAPADMGPDGKSCVQIGDQPGIGRLLVNACSECRVATVQRIARDGSRKSVRTVLDARSFLPVNTSGATSTSVVQDAPCPARR